MGNGPVVGCTSTSSKLNLANGGCKERPISYLSNDASFPSGGFASLHLPVVVVFMLIYFFCKIRFLFLEIINPEAVRFDIIESWNGFIRFSFNTFCMCGIQVSSHETSLMARCRRVYAHAHDYHINSISNNRCVSYLMSLYLYFVLFMFFPYLFIAFLFLNCMFRLTLCLYTCFMLHLLTLLMEEVNVASF